MIIAQIWEEHGTESMRKTAAQPCFHGFECCFGKFGPSLILQIVRFEA